MSRLQSNTEGFEWYDSLEDAKSDGFSVVRVTSLFCFFMLRGRSMNITLENLIPIPNLYYLYKGKPDDKSPERFYKKEYRGYKIEELYFYKNSGGESDAIDIFRARCKSGDVYLLLDADQRDELSAMSVRLYKSHFSGDGTIPWKVWLALAENEIRYQDFKRTGEGTTGFKSLCKLFEQDSEKIWNKCKPPKE